MKVIFDLEIHSKYSRAVSKEMTLENIAEWCSKKGIDLVGTGDFTHPAWFGELKENLQPAEPGVFKFKKPSSSGMKKTRFLLQGEISCVYSKNGKGRRVHHLVYAPSFEAAGEINYRLSRVGNIRSDGRPIIGLDSKELLKILMEASPEAYLIPAHIWTPWFGILGSKSGFNSIEECFEELVSNVFAVETGLSSDPSMNWRQSFLDDKSVVSGSDAHSLPKLGREATVLDIENISYSNVFDAIKSRDPKKILYTIEFFPEEGKYYYDGHRDAGHSQSPEITRKAGGKCARCWRPIVVGVMSRVEELADPKRPDGWHPENFIPYKKIIPLEEIIADINKVGVSSKKVRDVYNNLLKNMGSEFEILLEASFEQIKDVSADSVLAEAILRVRDGEVEIDPGYDGEFGKIKIFNK